MAGARQKSTEEVVFEGVVIPRGTRSAEIAAKGIANDDELGKFLTAVFSDTLNGKITLPTRKSAIRPPSRTLNDLGQKLRQGFPARITAKEASLDKAGKPKANDPR